MFQPNLEISGQAKQEAPPGGLEEAAKVLAELQQNNLNKKQEIQKPEDGGHLAVVGARKLQTNPDLPQANQAKLGKLATETEAAGESWRVNPNNELARQKLNNCVRELKAAVAEQAQELAKCAQKNAEFNILTRVQNARELFQNIQVTVKQENGSQVLQGQISLAEFQQLDLAGKETYLKALHEALKNKNNPGSSEAATKTLKGILAGKEGPIPRKWKAYAQEALAGKGQDSPEHAASWLIENIPKMQLITEQYRQFLESNWNVINRAGLSPVTSEVFGGYSTSERNRYLENLKSQIATFDQATAKRLDGLKIQDKNKVTTLAGENQAEVEKKEQQLSIWSAKTAQNLQRYLADSGFNKLVQKAENELKARPDNSQEVADISQLRQRQQQEGTFSRLKAMFGLGKPKENLQVEDGQSLEEGKQVDSATKARKQVIAEMTPEQQKNFFQEVLDSNPPKTPEELAAGLKFLTIPKPDAASIAALANGDDLVGKIRREAANDERFNLAA